MTTLYLVRHGQKLPESGDPGLSQIGLLQAAQTGEYLKQFPITKVITSPFKRTLQTVEQICKVLQLTAELNPAVVERMNLEAHFPKKEFIAQWIRASKDRDFVPTFGDSSRATGQRIKGLVENIAPTEKHVVLVTHGGAIVDFLRTMFDDEAVESLKKQYDEGVDYQMRNCAVNRVELGEKPAIRQLHFTDHLTHITE